MSADPQGVTLKTAVNTRAPLADRVPRPKRHDELVPAATALHHGIYTTYDNAYGAVPARSDTSDGNRYLTLLRSMRSGLADGSGANPSAATHPLRMAVSHARRHCPPLVSVPFPTAEWETELRGSGRHMEWDACRDFYSSARRIERVDDDLRGGLVGNTQRAVDIARKRATNPALCPPEARYACYPPQRPPSYNDINGRPMRSCLDAVDCTQLAPPTEAQLGFDRAPLERLPMDPCNPKEVLPIPTDVVTQERLLTRWGTSRPLFAGTAKVQEAAVPNYAGHVPAHAENVAKMRGNDTDPIRVWAKAFMTLAEHGGGVDAGFRCKNPLVRRKTGTRARAVKELKPRNEETIRQTVEGDMLQTTVLRTTAEERSINRREDKNPRIFH